MTSLQSTDPMRRLLILDYDGVCLSCVDPAHPTIDPEVSELIRYARQAGITVAVLSNELDDHTINNTPMLRSVDHVVVCSAGIQKPDRRAFQRVMLLTGIEASNTVVVDDSRDNIRGAAAAGAVAVHFDATNRRRSWTAVRSELGSLRPR